MRGGAASAGRRCATAAAVFALALLAAAPAGADLFRCIRADGSATFTDDPSRCARSQTHDPSGSIQRADAPAPRRPREAERASEVERGREAYWRRQLGEKRQELARLEQQRELFDRYVTHCNRGGELIGRDEASGLKHGISCDAVRREFASLDGRLASLRDYLERGIHEECRRAGCLPGWLR